MWYQVLIKLSMALVIGGAIGYEREYLSRPAGLRTHALVCVGASLVQIVSIDYGLYYAGTYSFDPFRLGAQVISGIGFLGAGTIIKEGVSVKGLTTAASIWTVACMGLAVGAGLYYESVVAAIFIFIVLKGLKKIENQLLKNKKTVILRIVMTNIGEKIMEITHIIEECGINVLSSSIDFSNPQQLKIVYLLECSKEIPIYKMLEKISGIHGIQDAQFKSAVDS